MRSVTCCPLLVTHCWITCVFIKTLNLQAVLIQLSKPLVGAVVFKRSVDYAVNRFPNSLVTS